MAAWRELLVLKKYFTRSLRSVLKYFPTLEEKFWISVRPCNIFYLYVLFLSIYKKNDKSCYLIVFLISVITPCLPLNPCENNGACSLVTSTSFSCSCSPDYEGFTCQTSKHFNILAFTFRILKYLF